MMEVEDQGNSHPLNQKRKRALFKKRAPTTSSSSQNVVTSSAGSKYRKYSVTPHPNGVKPLGNIYFDNRGNCRDTGLGNLAVLLDEIIIFILE
jgi:hypothetical protein